MLKWCSQSMSGIWQVLEEVEGELVGEKDFLYYNFSLFKLQ